MEIKGINELEPFKIIYNTDSNGREINIYEIHNTIVTGESLFYPNPILKTVNDKLINPINERVMSLQGVDVKYNVNSNEGVNFIITTPVFFFIYNTDNYYHFVYDTLPYLISFIELRKEIPNLKLLMNYPNSGKVELYKFVKEFLEILNIGDDDIIMVKKNTLYKSMYVSTSYTHGLDSNLPPRKEIYDFYQGISELVKSDINTPKKIYVSRRSWKHGDFSNIGTNYTTRRKLTNEDDLVELLEANGYVEVFTETLTTREKINYFNNATDVIGSIGGGLANVLFSNNKCKLTAIVSPEFLNINERFTFSFNTVNLTLFYDVKHTEISEIKSFMRVKVGDIIGEVIEVMDDDVKISYNDTSIAGWNNDVKYKTKVVKIKDCVKLDEGLNSPWAMNINKFKKIVEL